MSERLIVFEPGDRFVTLAEDGVARVFTVAPDGSLAEKGKNR